MADDVILARLDTGMTGKRLALETTSFDVAGSPAKAYVFALMGSKKGATIANAMITHTPQGDDHEGLDVTLYAGGSVISPLTDAQLRATPVPVSGTFWQATQPVSGPLTDAQLRATPVPVSGTFWQATQPVSGTFWQATQPVSMASSTVGGVGAKTFDFDEDEGTDTVPVFGIALPAVGGAVVGGTVTNPLHVGLATGTNSVGKTNGQAAIDAAIAGNPHLMGGRASTATPAAVSADGDVQAPWLDRNGAAFIRNREFTTYVGTCRLAATNAISSLSWNAAANTDKQLATIYHAGTSTKTKKLRRVEVNLADNTTATVLNLELRRLSATTAPATGNPAITPLGLHPASGTSEAVILCLPTTAGSEAAANSPLASIECELGILAGQVGANNTRMDTYVLWEDRGDAHTEPAIMIAGTAGGYAICGRVVTASNPVRFTARFIYTEEP